MKADSINLVDKARKMFVKIKLSDNRKYWERWVSLDKKKWEMTERIDTLEGVLKSQQDLIDKNYRNLFDVITKK